MVRDLAYVDDSEPWQLDPFADPDDSRFLLSELRPGWMRRGRCQSRTRRGQRSSIGSRRHISGDVCAYRCPRVRSRREDRHSIGFSRGTAAPLRQGGYAIRLRQPRRSRAGQSEKGRRHEAEHVRADVWQHATRNWWEARYVGADGRRHSLYAKTRREAQERLRVALTAADHGIRPVGRAHGRRLPRRLARDVGCAALPPRTVESYPETVDRYICPAIGRVPLAKLEPEHVARMLAEPDCPRRSLPYHGSLRLRDPGIALGRALKSGRVVRNVATLVDPPAKVRHEPRPLTAEQVGRLIDATADDRLGPLYALAIATGCDRASCSRSDGPTSTSTRARCRAPHAPARDRELAEPKTDRGAADPSTRRRDDRAAPRPPTRQLAERLAAGADGRMATTCSRRPSVAPRQPERHPRFQEALARAGLPRQRFHDLRHAYATLMIEDGEELASFSRSSAMPTCRRRPTSTRI